MVRRSRAPGESWFKFSPAEYFCPDCATRIQPVTRPIGYGLFVGMLVTLFILANLPGDSWWIQEGLLAKAVSGGAIAIVWMALIVGFAKWGLRFALYHPRAKGGP